MLKKKNSTLSNLFIIATPINQRIAGGSSTIIIHNLSRNNEETWSNCHDTMFSSWRRHSGGKVEKASVLSDFSREEGGGVGNWVALALNSKGEGWTGSRREINELAEAETNYRVGRIS